MIHQRGATLVEVLVAIALTSIMLPTLALALVTSHAGRATSQQQLQAVAMLHEANEAVRAARDANWSAVATDGIYHPVISGTDWALASGPETVNGLTRQITIATAERDGGGLVLTGGDPDPTTKHITISVTWSTPYDSSAESDLYLTNWRAGP